VPQTAENRALLAAHGTVVYLYTGVAEQLRRTGKSRNRPLLNAGDRQTVLTELLERRDPLYREIADIVVETDGRQVPAVTRELLSMLNDSKE
jgi:shikimate kinase